MVVMPCAVFISPIRSELRARVVTADCAAALEAAPNNDTNNNPIDPTTFKNFLRLELECAAGRDLISR